MRTFRPKFKAILAFSFFISIFSGYNPVFAETVETKDQDTHHQAQKSLDWPGIYLGFMPCADCIGLKTTLALNKNNSYVLITQYVGRSGREFVEKGTFTWGNNNETIVLKPRNSSTTQQYAVGKNTLIQLDSNGNRVTGKLADRYILRRTDVTGDTPPDHSGH